MEVELMTSSTLDYVTFAYSIEEKQRCAANSRGAAFNLGTRERKIVCVTSGNSQLSSLIIKELLKHGYLVRVTLQHHEDFEEMKVLITEVEMNQLENVVVAKMGDMEALCDAFRGCHAVFHTSSFIDPRGVSGYSERMAFLETEAARNVVEACGRTAYVKRCIFTSSLLTSIWNNKNIDDVNVTVDETCWSDEDFCRTNKLWLALGKTRAEKMAWRKSKEFKVKLITICPGLIIPPPLTQSTNHVTTTTSIPYLKGTKAMFQNGHLAVENIVKLAKTHVRVYEEMDYGANGRYLSFEKVVTRSDEMRSIENEVKVHGVVLRNGIEMESEVESKVSNGRLKQLVARCYSRCCREELI